MPLRLALLALVIAALPATALAQQPCQFLQEDEVWHLLNDCQTDHSIEIPDGVRLDGELHFIVAIDAPDHPFAGAVILARGRRASIVNIRIGAVLLADDCLTGDAGLRGIYFDGASGEIANNVLTGISRGAAACAEGNAIEVRNRDRDGVAAAVTIRDNRIDNYQKTAIVVHGNVDATIEANAIGTSIAHPVVVPNGIQVGPQAVARIHRNQIVGRFTGQVAAGAAILLFQSGPGTVVDENAIGGNPDIGIHVFADAATITDNVVRDTDASGVYDVGIVNQGVSNLFINNTVTGFRSSYYGVETVLPPSRGLQIE